MDAETGLVNYGNRYYSPGLGRFINRDPVEEAGGVNLYGFCGNDSINNFDVLGNSWLSKLWDHTVLSLGKHIALNWDHGRQYVELAAAIVVSCFVGFEVAQAVEAELMVSDAVQGAVIAAMGPSASVFAEADVIGAVATIGGGVAGGAAGGFVSGVALGAISGQNLGQALQSGLKGAEFGMLQGGITAGVSALNSELGDLAKPAPINESALGHDIEYLGIKGVEGAITNKLEDKNASVGFWNGVDSGLMSIQMVPSSWKQTDLGRLGEDLVKGVVGGLTSVNKAGKGFMTGFWNAESKVAITAADSRFDSKISNPWERYPLRTLTSALVQGSVGRFQGKTFSSGLFTGGESQALNDALGGIERNPEKVNAASGPVKNLFKLLTPKVSHNKTVLPLDTIKGGYWALGANWAQLFSQQASP